MSSNSRTSGSIGDINRPSALTPKASVVHQEDPKVLVDLQHLTAMRRSLAKAVDRCVYVVREVEDRLYPLIEHDAGCPAIENDEVHCKMSCPGRELRMTLKTIVVSMMDVVDRATIRKFGKNDFYAFPSREAYTALVTEIEYLRDKVVEFQPQSTTDADVKKLLAEHYAPALPSELEVLQLQEKNEQEHTNGTTETATS